MGKCISDYDRCGDEKEEMINWKKIFEILLPSFLLSFVLFGKSRLICIKKKMEMTDNESGR